MQNTITAILREELESFLKRIGLLGAVRAGTVNCHECGCTVTLENFGAVAKQGSELIVFCNRPTCRIGSGRCRE